MILLYLGLGLLVAVSALGYATTRIRFAWASAARVVALGVLTYWLLGPAEMGRAGLPVVAYVWLAFAWATFVGYLWPEFTAVWRERLADSKARPDRRSLPQVLGAGAGGISCGVALWLAALLFFGDFTTRLESAGMPGPSLVSVMVWPSAICGACVLAGVFTLVRGRRQPWYTVQQAYVAAAATAGAGRHEAVHRLVDSAIALSPADDGASPAHRADGQEVD